MKSLKIILIIILLIMLWTGQVMAEEPGIHGEASFRYELGDQFPGQSWLIDLHYRFTNWLSVGAAETTYTNGYATYFDAIPAFIPTNQLYEIYLQVNLNENASIKLSQWCNHPVYSGKLSTTIVPNGLYIEGKYKF